MRRGDDDAHPAFAEHALDPVLPGEQIARCDPGTVERVCFCFHRSTPKVSSGSQRCYHRLNVSSSRLGALITSSVGMTLLALSGPAAAQTDEAAAQVQFEKGLSEMRAGHHATGCPALAESYRLDPKAGALFTLAECEAQWGRVASAVAHYDEFAKKAAAMPPAQREAQRAREKVAQSQLELLRPRIPQLTVTLPPGAPDGAVVKKDGVVVAAPSLGVALPVDPGEHVFALETPDGGRTESRVVLAASEHKEVVLELPKAPAAEAGLGPAGPAADTGGSRLPAYVAFGVGAPRRWSVPSPERSSSRRSRASRASVRIRRARTRTPRTMSTLRRPWAR